MSSLWRMSRYALTPSNGCDYTMCHTQSACQGSHWLLVALLAAPWIVLRSMFNVEQSNWVEDVVLCTACQSVRPDWWVQVSCSPARSFFRLFVCYQTCEHIILKMNEVSQLILMPVSTSSPWGKGFWCSALGSGGQRFRSLKAEDRSLGLAEASLLTPCVESSSFF